MLLAKLAQAVPRETQESGEEGSTAPSPSLHQTLESGLYKEGWE